MFEATSWSELPNPQKGLTKLTKLPFTTRLSVLSVLFRIDGASETEMLPPRRPGKPSFTRQFFEQRQRPGWARDVDTGQVILAIMRSGNPLLCQRDS